MRTVALATEVFCTRADEKRGSAKPHTAPVATRNQVSFFFRDAILFL